MLIIFALLVSSVTSQGIPGIQQGAAMASGCFRKSFTKSFPAGAFKCASINEQNAKTLPGGMSRESRSTSTWGYPLPEKFGALSPGHEPPTDLSRRTAGMLLGAAALGMPFTSRAASDSGDIKLVTFDNPGNWKLEVDPATAGNSQGKLSFKDGALNLNGYCQYRPFLTQKRQETSGFIKVDTTDQKFPDVSACEGISVVAKQTGIASNKVGEEKSKFEGYNFCIGGNRAGETSGKLAKRSRLGNQCYKSKLNVPQNEFGTIQIPFKDFSNFWDAETGAIVVSCEQSPKNCPDQATLANMRDMSFWAEGDQGDFNLEVKSVIAYGCTAKVSELATNERARNISFLWLPAVGTLGALMIYVLVYTGTRPTSTGPPLLG